MITYYMRMRIAARIPDDFLTSPMECKLYGNAITWTPYIMDGSLNFLSFFGDDVLFVHPWDLWGIDPDRAWVRWTPKLEWVNRSQLPVVATGFAWYFVDDPQVVSGRAFDEPLTLAPEGGKLSLRFKAFMNTIP